MSDEAYYNANTVFITGTAKPGNEDAIKNVYQVFSLSLIVDTRTDQIVDSSCTAVMNMTNNYIRSILIGRNLVTEVDEIANELRARFMALVQKTLIVSLRDAQNRYLMAFPEKRLPKNK
ncbi:MAG: DUF3870 domain-containing protein [Oscillospiraceae bacterium]|nr:DUF3870 domain-containing protein [Oscillospiraceae bacterium]